MLLTIIGSGGYLRIPKPCCQCKVCKDARKSIKERRLGPALFIDDLDLLIDTPEDIAEGLNYADIREVNHIIYSHWHPDHAAGWRVVEQIAADIDFRSSHGKKNSVTPKKRIVIHVPDLLLNDLIEKYPGLSYMEECGFTDFNIINSEFKIRNHKIRVFKQLNSIPSYVYSLQGNGKKIVICMDHAKDTPITEELMNPDCLIMQMGYLEHDVKQYIQLPVDHVRRADTSFRDNIKIIDNLNPKLTVLIHLEELWSRNRQDYDDWAKKLNQERNIIFAHDGLKINI